MFQPPAGYGKADKQPQSIMQQNASSTIQIQTPGVASRVGELQNVVTDALNLALQVRVALGIEDGTGNQGNTPAPSTLADVLVDLRNKVLQVNEDLKAVLSHINS